MTQPSSAQTNAPVAEAIDDCGLRFLLASRHHVYLLNTLPLRQRAQMQQFGLSPAYYVWAFHSESQDELLNSLPSMQKGAPTWAEMRQFGVGWWLRNINSLQRCAEKVGQPFCLIIPLLSIIMWCLRDLAPSSVVPCIHIRHDWWTQVAFLPSDFIEYECYTQNFDVSAWSIFWLHVSVQYLRC